MSRRRYRVINKYALLHIDAEGLHAIGPRGGVRVFSKMRNPTQRAWFCCQCAGRIDYGERAWRPDMIAIEDRICDFCAAQMPGYRVEGKTAAERNRPGREVLALYPLIAHAYRELDLAHLFDDGMDLGACVLKMIEILARHKITDPTMRDLALKTFWDLAHERPLTGLTNTPEEWQDISHQAGRSLWRNIRDKDAFSEDGGHTFYRIETPHKRLATRTVREEIYQ